MTAAPAASAPALPPGIAPAEVFRSIFFAYPDSLLLVDGEGVIVLANPAAELLLGYAPGELPGLNVDRLVPDASRPRHAAYRGAYAHAPRARPMGTQMDLVARCKDGREVMVEIALSPLQDHGVPLVVAAIRGIEAYPRVKQALQRARYSEHLAQLGRLAVDSRDLQALLDRVPEITAEALQVEASTVFLLEGDRQSFRVASGVGGVAAEQVGARIANRPETPLGMVAAEGQPVTVADYRHETRFSVTPAYLQAGWVSALAVPLSDRGRVIGVLSAASTRAQRFGDEERRFMESLANLLASTLQRAQSEEALSHSQRLESVGQLTGGIAHDFNNLLTVIQGNLQVIEELPALAGDAFGRQLVEAATRATARAAELTGKLLAFSRRQVLQPSAVDVELMLRSLASMLERTLDQRIRIEIDVAPGCPPVLADPGQLESALLNIAINARDAMVDGGVLSFRVAPCEQLPTTLRQMLRDPSAPADGFVAIAIADNGSGMSDEVLERAFEPFFTTKQAGRGTGLGLSTVYGFIQQSRGAIGIASAPGAGTTVTLYIPKAPPAQHATAETHEHTFELLGLKVLAVEDDAAVRQVVQTFLQTLGCEATLVSSAEQALLVLRPGADFDLLLTDIALGPGMRGTQLAAEAQRRCPDIAVLLMSGYSAELLDADKEAPPSWELLRKPYSRAELGRAIAGLMAARRA